MRKVLFILGLIYVFNSCNDDNQMGISSFSTSERISQNLLSADINGSNKKVGIYSVKTEVGNPNKEHLFVQYYLENSTKRFYEFVTTTELLLIENDFPSLKGAGGFVVIDDFGLNEFALLYKLDTSSFIKTYDCSRKWVTMDISLKYVQNISKQYYPFLEDTVVITAKNIKVRRYDVCDFQ